MVLRHFARPLLASWFVYSGVQAALSPQVRAAQVAPELDPVLADMGLAAVSSEDVVKAHGVATAAAGVSLALSRTPRTSALLLAALHGGTLGLDRPFWKESDAEKRREGLENLLKNVALLGGVLIAASAGHSARHNNRAKAKKAKAHEKAHQAKVASAQKAANSQLKKYFR
jgi:uncharacterized membrane protein YphA (DoxX/SURF4 family)